MAARTRFKFHRRYRTGALLALLSFPLAPASTLASESAGIATPKGTPSGIRGSLERLRDSDAPDFAFSQSPSPSPSPTPPPPHGKRSTGRKFLGFILGAGVGMVAGLFMGAALEPDCNCDDPGLEWGLYGAGIGIVAGGTAGVLIASH